MKNEFYEFIDDGVSFVAKDAAYMRTIYFPICGPDSLSLKACISPYLSGDIKLDKSHYITKPVSREDLRNNLRNFFVNIKGKGVFSLTDRSDDGEAIIEIGQLWHKFTNINRNYGVKLEATNFIPVSGENLEVMTVTVENISSKEIEIFPTFCIPVFARSLSNKHDHEHVTSLLNRINQLPQGICVEPTMVFNEEGHSINNDCYYVFGVSKNGDLPLGTFPTVDNFLGRGTFLSPDAVILNIKPELLSREDLDGKEACGAIAFNPENLSSGEKRTYIFAIGLTESLDSANKIFENFNNLEKCNHALEENKKYWIEKGDTLKIEKGDNVFNSWFSWVRIQPVLRRIFGCSFLPDHDYGKGGRGWRDLWQDLLSLTLIEPEMVRETLVSNFKGVRIDGSNATIIGESIGEFIADRNAITRVWMDHGAWPVQSILLYINQSGDFDILFEEVPYFKDVQLSRTKKKDSDWSADKGNALKDSKGDIYEGTILEHLLIQTLVQFFNVGEHNIMRLESADWNDGLDMAFERGESVAFSCFYAGNLIDISNILEYILNDLNIKEVKLGKELEYLLDTLGDNSCNYDDVDEKKRFLFDKYFCNIEPNISGEKKVISVDNIIKDLRAKGQWLFNHIRENEFITVDVDDKKFSWFNGYYDNEGVRVEGKKGKDVLMTLTGQVFPIMSGVSDKEQTKEVVASVKEFLKDKKLGGYRLNTDFGVPHYLSLGRAFGFAYGTKENGAFFSHMCVMYAYALYKAGFVHEGFDVMDSLYKMSMDTEKSKIYPNVPEYFDSQGQGMYCYLTGAASWIVHTNLTQVFGVRGHFGDLLIEPKLVLKEFSENNTAVVECNFASKKVKVIYNNPDKLDWGQYKIDQISVNNEMINIGTDQKCSVCIKSELISNSKDFVNIDVVLK